jgi:alpha-tubulin suppressor-like RCC1 family protein
MVYGFGENSNGRLGIGNNNDQNTPIPMIEQNAGVFAIACGSQHTLFLKYQYSCFGKGPTDSTICSSNGLCTQTNQCTCNTGYFGTECQTTSCFGVNSNVPTVCSGKGTCNRFDLCTCNAGYDGKNCEFDLNPVSTSVYSFGENSNGVLGLGGGGNRNTPTKVTTFNLGITKLFRGHTTFYMQNNVSKSFSCGRNHVSSLHILFFLRLVN